MVNMIKQRMDLFHFTSDTGDADSWILCLLLNVMF
jgi:hypothetical protein